MIIPYKSLLTLVTLICLLVHKRCFCTPVPLFQFLRTNLAEQNLTLFRAIAISTPIPNQPDMCIVKGTIFAGITHARKVTSKLIQGLASAVSIITNAKQKVQNVQDLLKYWLSKGTEGLSVTFTLKIALSKDVRIQSEKSDSQGIIETTFQFASVPCSISWIPIECVENLMGFGTQQVQVIPNSEGYTVFSDIDDTIRQTGVLSKMQVFNTTFLNPFTACVGSVQFYTYLNLHLQTKTSPVVWHYVSGSPHQLYTPLRQFVQSAGFPIGTLFLQKGDFWFGSNTQTYKLNEIRSMFHLFPHRSYILIGDSSQLDPETYGILARNATVDIKCIYIRKVTGYDGHKELELNSDDRFTTAFNGVSRDKWVVFSDPSEVMNADIPNGRCK